MFPIIFYTYSYNYVINHLQINSNKKNLNFEIFYTKKILKLIIFFKKVGLIKTFFIVKNKDFKIKIFIFYYKKLPICKNLKLYSTPSRIFTISYKALLLLNNRMGSSFYILSTPFGLITHFDALKFKIGGKIIMLISL